MYLRHFQLNMAALFLRAKFLKWVNHFAENSQTRNFSEPKMFQKLRGEPASMMDLPIVSEQNFLRRYFLIYNFFVTRIM